PETPTRPIAMPTGTRSNIIANNATNPMIATASVLIARSFDGLGRGVVDQFEMKDQPIGADRDQQHGRYVTGPGDGKKRPGRQPQVESEDVVVICAAHFVEQ